MVSPLDFVKLSTVYVDREVAQARYDVCKKCEFLLPTTQCRKCLCFMKAKVKFAEAACPVNKWASVKVESK
jgi:hypothetical protein